ncbi:MAG: MBL fold metallo-hydrolase [Candidatus Bathyarchaeia archaeon]
MFYFYPQPSGVPDITSLTFYGGVGEVGGNKILLKDGDASVFFDFGMSIQMKKRYYSTPMVAPRSERSLLAFGILPSIDGVYKFDNKRQSVDAVFLSHSHSDHAAYISFLKNDIPVYCGETTATILKTLNETRAGGFEFNLDDKCFRTFRTGDTIRIGNIEVEPIHVDHSVPGAYGFLAHTSSGTIVYTGDLRIHGERPHMSEEFIEASCKSKPIAVITEGTNMVGATISTEAEVANKVCRVVQNTSGLVLADFAVADIDRLRSFQEAAEASDRRLVVTMRQAYLLSKLKVDPHLELPQMEDGRILIYLKKKKRYYLWEKEVMSQNNVVDSEKIAAMQNKVILVCSYYDFEELVDIKPLPQSCHILSSSEPYNEEMELEFERLINWLVCYGLPQYHIHVSGHIMPLQLLQMLKRIGSRRVFLIHCQYPELFVRFLGVKEFDAVNPELGREYSL